MMQRSVQKQRAAKIASRPVRGVVSVRALFGKKDKSDDIERQKDEAFRIQQERLQERREKQLARERAMEQAARGGTKSGRAAAPPPPAPKAAPKAKAPPKEEIIIEEEAPKSGGNPLSFISGLFGKK